MGREDGERGEKGMKVVWRREMEVEGWREKQVEKGEKWGWGGGGRVEGDESRERGIEERKE